MFRSRIAKWSYQFGWLSAAVAIIYRVFWFGGLGARLFGAAPHIVPHNFMDLSVLLLVISIATNFQTLIHREDSKTLSSGKV
jgi:hypothetical protein